MCGVVGLVSERARPDLGRVAARMLLRLEYRGYDSTGAALLSETDGDALGVDLRKAVGAPSRVLDALGVPGLAGRVFCGQVRWATFGVVDERNAQPHEVRCRVHLVGAHNGNVTNCDERRAELLALGHDVVSENDGEMVVHTVEEAFFERLEAAAGRDADDEARRRAMRLALSDACRRLEGSFAAVVVDPATGTAWAVKRGSSLYFGLGEHEEHGAFGVASSDLSAVLDLTRRLLPLEEGEFVEFDARIARVFELAAGGGPPRLVERAPRLSRLKARDTGLREPFGSFMEQEIADQPRTVADVVRVFEGGGPRARAVRPALEGTPEADRARLQAALETLRQAGSEAEAREAFALLSGEDTFRKLLAAAPPPAAPLDESALHSAEAGLLLDVAATGAEAAEAALADALFEIEEVVEHELAVERFLRGAEAAERGRGRLFAVSCGSSFHAARALSIFFDRLAGVRLTALLPGDYRAEAAASLRDGDVVLAISQSGETKDLIDVLDDVERSGGNVVRAALVNNVNSTIALEKTDVVVPLRCGPEVAVPATKSFLNQLAVGFGLALRLAERLGSKGADLTAARSLFAALPDLVRRTLEETRGAVEEASEALALAPSLHLLGTRLLPIALEGALKIREVVLNHAQGYEASEFKHGPNTILGQNTVLGPREVEEALAGGGAPRERLRRLLEAPRPYPLLFLTGPDERDVRLTISQIHTHKIRGGLPVLVAEENALLRRAAGKDALYIALPPGGGLLGTLFTATVALQRLALRMSEKKARWLDELGVREHGVHPDVPKNVSKSITVD